MRADTLGGWIRTTLAEIAEVIQGQSPPGNTYSTAPEGLPFFQGKAEFGPIHPVASKWCNKPSKVAEAGDILISIRAPVGPTNLADAKCCIGRGLAAIRPQGGIPARFLDYYLKHSVSLLTDQATGTTFDAIGGAQLRGHPIVLPPLREQVEIVAAIESYITRLDGVEATLARVKRNLERYRSSVLQAAVEGRLVPASDGFGSASGSGSSAASTQSPAASSLATRKSAGRLWGAGVVPALTASERNRIPSHWTWKKVLELGRDPDEVVQVGPMSMRSEDFTSTGTPVLNVGCIGWGRFNEAKLNFLPDSIAAGFSRYRIQPGDVLFTRSGTVGRCAVARPQFNGWLMTFHLLRVRTDHDICLPEYLRIVFEGAAHIRRQTREASIGSTRAGFNTRLLQTLDVPLPSLVEQRLIVETVDALLSVEGDAARLMREGTAKLRALRQAILRWGFEGHLVDQDPTDEPASVLLDRIRTERAKAASSPESPRYRSRPRKAVTK